MPDRFRSVLLLGAPGVGKGTQGKLLGGVPGMVHLATGDMFRSLNQHSELRSKCLEYSSRGELVPDDLTIRLWREYVQKLIDSGTYSPARDLLILDGIPRSLNQAKAIDRHISVLGIVHLTAPDIDALVARITRRAKQEGRGDDREESVIRRRFAVYDEETRPLLRSYDRSLIREVNAIGTPADVLLRVLNVVVPIYTEHFGNPLENG